MSFQEVRGHEPQIEMLRRAIMKERIFHAYLFVGLEGIGKKLVAQSFAQALNCRETPNEGCGFCPSCRKIAQHIHPDCLFLEPKDGSIKIDQIRDLQSRIIFHPFEGKRKVVTVNDSERMTVQAANCLLKSLEEPLPDTMFILITRELRSLLPTIVSRCQIVRFQPLSSQQLQQVIEEKLEGEEKITDVLISLSGGSVRKAIEMAENGFMFERTRLFERVARLPQEGISTALDLAAELASVKEGVEEKLELLKMWYHDLMVCKKIELQERIVNRDLLEKIEEESCRFTLKELFVQWKVVRETQVLLKKNVNAQLAMERMFIKLAGAKEEQCARL
jgi:DNA polymerase-3 subunit delta'